jgi:hypothetical protein
MDYEQLFEAKRQELARLEQREAFLRSQLEEAVQIRLKLIGAMEMLQELHQRQQKAAGEQTEADKRLSEIAAHLDGARAEEMPQ